MLGCMQSSLKRLKLTWLAAALATTLWACGGGGDAPAPTPAAALTPATPPTVVSPASSAAETRATCELANFRAEALALVNSYRASSASCGSSGNFVATTPLAWNDALTQASLVHSDDMMALNYFNHTGSDGSSAGQRATAAGYAWQTWGENIAAGQNSVASVMSAWLASPGHCANLMNPNFRDIGLACVSGSASNAYRSYWAMTLGAAR